MIKPITSLAQIAQILYNADPATLVDERDEDIQTLVSWDQAQMDKPPEYFEAVGKATLIKESLSGPADLVKIIGRDALLGEMGSFTWFFGTDWLVETRFGNFHWKDPDYGDGDNSFTFFPGTMRQFCHHLNVGFGRDKGNSLIVNRCGKDIELIVP